MSVTHHREKYEERWEQPGNTWTHDDWYMAYCFLCEADGSWEPPERKDSR